MDGPGTGDKGGFPFEKEEEEENKKLQGFIFLIQLKISRLVALC